MERCFIEDWSIMKSSPLDATDEVRLKQDISPLNVLRSSAVARLQDVPLVRDTWYAALVAWLTGIRQARASQEPSESKNQSDQSSQTLSD
ncbi:hypothetical protein IAQ61_001065 [Plenodomus lingam]|uniref:uncharacterized protein n=1 Tax=Leptosphaeria maculans TaxID=5022 RepID=UPI0033174936|nr:hypothetical protein IAQ61_001065 [Plenodomus lingam]